MALIETKGAALKINEAFNQLYGVEKLLVILTKSYGIRELIEKITECIGVRQNTESLSVSRGYTDLTETCIQIAEDYGTEFFVHKLLNDLPKVDIARKMFQLLEDDEIACQIMTEIGYDNVNLAMQNNTGQWNKLGLRLKRT